MGQQLSCGIQTQQVEFFNAIRDGVDVNVRAAVERRPPLVNHPRWFVRRLSPLHLAASKGHLEVLRTLLEHGADVDALDRYGKTALMLACKKGKWECALELLSNGANVLVFGMSRGRTCLHYAAKAGNAECVQKILFLASSGTVSSSWGVARFVNIHDRNGITALHLASFRNQVAVVRLLLENGAFPSAASGPPNQLGGGRTPLHFAARGGAQDCIKELLAWGADPMHRDHENYTAYAVAIINRNFACAALLDPRAGDPVVWSSPLKFLNEVQPEAKQLLETAIRKAKEQQKKQIEEEKPPCSQELDDLCSICFERACSIQVVDCGHMMCATCTLKVCKQKKSTTLSVLRSSPPTSMLPICPFCRSQINRLVLVSSSSDNGNDESPRCESGRFKRKPSIPEGCWIATTKNEE